MKPVLRTIILCTCASAVAISTAASAQTTNESAAIPRSNTGLEEIIVTALKRTQDSFEIPGSVTVVDSQALVTRAIDAAAAITRQAPNFAFSGFGQPGNDFVNMRGIGILGQPANSLDNTVGFASNGVSTSALGFTPSLMDIERIEILRGPQGTLFGRNALGGLVNIVTRKADGQSEHKLTGETGSQGYRLAEFVSGAWLQQDVLAARVAIRHQQQDGDIDNIVVGGKEGENRLSAARGSLRYTPNPDLLIDLITGFDRSHEESSFLLLLEHPDFPVSGADRIPQNTRDRFEMTLNVQRQLSTMTLTSVTNVQDITFDGDIDLAGDLVFGTVFGIIPTRGADRILSDEQEQLFSQEIRLNSLPEQTTSWVVGMNYFSSDYRVDRDSSSTFSPYSSGFFDTDIDSQIVSVFGDISVALNPALTLSGGLRVAHDKQDLATKYRGKGFTGTVAQFKQRSAISDTYVTGQVSLSYDVNDTSMSYISLARGYASGGFAKATINAAVGQDTTAFEPSTGHTVEMGIKSRFLDNRAQITFSAFFNDIKKGQLLAANTATTPTTFVFVNQDYETYGVEFEGKLLATDSLKLSASIGATETEINNVAETALAGIEDGNQVPGAPRVTSTLSLEHQWSEHWFTTVEHQFVGSRAADAQNTDDLDSYTILNARLTWTLRDIDISLFGNNLEDERAQYFLSTYSDSAHVVAIGPGRVVGVGITWSF